MNDRPALLVRTELGLQIHSANFLATAMTFHRTAFTITSTTSTKLIPRYCFSLFAATLSVLLLAGSGRADDLVETLVAETTDQQMIEGAMDWTNRLLTVYGEGLAPDHIENSAQRRLLGLRAAKVAAMRNLLELVGHVQVDARTTVSMAMIASDSIRTQVSGILQGARVVMGSQQEKDGLYRLAVRIELRDEFAETVLAPSVPGANAAHRLPPASLPASDSLLVFIPPEPYTGLIVDARGLDLRPSMAPRIVDEEGRLIYSAQLPDRHYATQMGVVGYQRDIDRALSSDRLGGEKSHPFVVRATGVTGTYGTDAVIGREEGIRVRMADTEGDFLSQCRVVFVLGPLPDPVDTSFSDSIDTYLGQLDSIWADSVANVYQQEINTQFNERQ